MVDHRFGCLALIGIGWNQIIEDRNAKEGTHPDQFIAKMLQVAAGAVTKIGAAQKIAPALIVFVP